MKLAFWTVTKGAGNIAREYKEKLKDGMPARYSVCEENPRINGIEVEIDEKTGKAISIERVNMGYDEV